MLDLVSGLGFRARSVESEAVRLGGTEGFCMALPFSKGFMLHLGRVAVSEGKPRSEICRSF